MKAEHRKSRRAAFETTVSVRTAYIKQATTALSTLTNWSSRVRFGKTALIVDDLPRRQIVQVVKLTIIEFRARNGVGI
jgi:hypothetical protein